MVRWFVIYKKNENIFKNNKIHTRNTIRNIDTNLNGSTEFISIPDRSNQRYIHPKTLHLLSHQSIFCDDDTASS